jgi:hypothetical protein
MEPAVDEDLDPAIRPSPQLRSEGRSTRERRFAPVIGHDQHGKSRAAEVVFESVGKSVYRTLEARGDVVDGCHQGATSPRGCGLPGARGGSQAV